SRRLDLLVDRLSLSPQNSAFPVLSALRGPDRKGPAPVSQLGGLGDLHRPLPGSAARHRAAGGRYVRAGIAALYGCQHHLGPDLGIHSSCPWRRDTTAPFPITL